MALGMSLPDILARVRAAEAEAGKQPGSTSLIAVSKLQPEERIVQILDQGHLIFGENRVQEAVAKWPALMESHPSAELHLLGPLQSNKVRVAMSLFRAIHSVDRLKIARRIATLAQELGGCPDLFIQINTGEERRNP